MSAGEKDILLHACCGPCSLEPTRILHEEGFRITIFYANPNIAPVEEYDHRLRTLLDWAQGSEDTFDDEGEVRPLGTRMEHPPYRIPVFEGEDYRRQWEETVGVLGDALLAQAQGDPLAVPDEKRQARCRLCYRLRFQEAARFARDHGFSVIGTTLSVSPYQYTAIIQQELEAAAAAYGLRAHFQDYRENYPEATRRSKSYGMYRQNYCGCRFSYDEAAAERALRKEQAKADREARRAKFEATHADELKAQAALKEEEKRAKQAYEAKQARKRAAVKAYKAANAPEPEND